MYTPRKHVCFDYTLKKGILKVIKEAKKIIKLLQFAIQMSIISLNCLLLHHYNYYIMAR